MVVANYFQRIDGVIKYADFFHCVRLLLYLMVFMIISYQSIVDKKNSLFTAKKSKKLRTKCEFESLLCFQALNIITKKYFLMFFVKKIRNASL